MNIPFFDLKRQYAEIRSEIEPAVLNVLSSCGYIGGKTVSGFEQQMSSYLNVKHTITCGNGTDALVLALRACGVQAGDEVITTPFSFFATAEAIASIGAKPVFADILPEDFTLNPEEIESKITPSTRAILPVHLFGAPCRMDEIMGIARKHGLKVIEDAAQAIGCEYKGRKVGSTADLSCFSFYPTKNLGGAGDGGMVTTDNDELATIVLALREHGAGKNGAQARNLLDGSAANTAILQDTGGGYDPYKYSNALIGYNSRLDAVQAAILSIKLKYLDSYNERRAKIASYYNKNLCGAVKKPAAPVQGRHCWHQYVVRTKAKDELCAFLNQHGIGVGTFYPIPLHLQRAFDSLNCHTGDFCCAEQAAAETVCLPVFPELTLEEQDYVIEQVNTFFHS